MLLKERIESAPHLSDSQQGVLNYMYENPHDIAEMTLKEIAAASYTSPATLPKIWATMDLKNYGKIL